MSEENLPEREGVCEIAREQGEILPMGKTMLRKWTKCCCGGWVLHVFQKEKIVYFGTPSYTYKEPRWQVVNCFPKRGAK